MVALRNSQVCDGPADFQDDNDADQGDTSSRPGTSAHVRDRLT